MKNGSWVKKQDLGACFTSVYRGRSVPPVPQRPGSSSAEPGSWWLCCFPGTPAPTFGQSTPVPGAVGSGSSSLSFGTPSTPASAFGGVGTSFGKGSSPGQGAVGGWLAMLLFGFGTAAGPGCVVGARFDAIPFNRLRWYLLGSRGGKIISPEFLLCQARETYATFLLPGPSAPAFSIGAGSKTGARQRLQARRQHTRKK